MGFQSEGSTSTPPREAVPGGRRRLDPDLRPRILGPGVYTAGRAPHCPKVLKAERRPGPFMHPIKAAPAPRGNSDTCKAAHTKMQWRDRARLCRAVPGSVAATGPLRAAGLLRGADSPGEAPRYMAVPLPKPVLAMPPSLFSAKQNHWSPNHVGTHVCEHTHTPHAHGHRMCPKTARGVRRGSSSFREQKLYCSVKQTDSPAVSSSGQEVLRLCLRRGGHCRRPGKGSEGVPSTKPPCGQRRGHDLRHFPGASSGSGDKRAKTTFDRHAHCQERTCSGP